MNVAIPRCSKQQRVWPTIGEIYARRLRLTGNSWARVRYTLSIQNDYILGGGSGPKLELPPIIVACLVFPRKFPL
jgi:hypothetical protein